MKYLLDTNSCIYLFVDEYPVLTERVASLPAGSLAISAITYAEIALGTFHGKPPVPEVLAAFVAEIPVLPFEQPVAEIYAQLPFRRGSFDRLIAAHAIALDVTLVSRNLADFVDIPALRVEDWTA